MSYLIDVAEASKLVYKIVADYYSRRRSPIPGAILKVELLKSAAALTKSFDEKELGFKSFSEFLSKCESVDIERRPGSDILVLPRDRARSEAQSISPRIRQDIWFAFVSFPIPGTERVYDPITDQVIYEQSPVQGSGKPVIKPIPTEQQLAWRKEFAITLGTIEEQELMRAFKAPNPFREFSISVRRQPTWSRAWNAFLLQKVSPIVEQWASENNIPRERLLLLPHQDHDKDQASIRKELYSLFDRITVEHLLQLQIPVGWIIKKD